MRRSRRGRGGRGRIRTSTTEEDDYGNSLRGRVCKPSGEGWIVDARVYVDIDDDGFDNDDVGTEVRTQNRDDYMAATPNALYWSSQNIIANSDDVFGNAAETDSFVADTTDPQVVSNTMALVDPRPSGHSSAYRTAEAVPSDPFFDQAGYRGAFGTWNWLEGWTSNHNNKKPFAVHYTRGGPWFDEWQDVEFASEWIRERDGYLKSKFIPA